MALFKMHTAKRKSCFLNVFPPKVEYHTDKQVKCTAQTHTHRHTLSVLLPDQHHFLSIQQTSRRERRQIQTDRERRKWQKGLWTERGLDTTIFCPTGVDTHGRPNQLRKARRGGGTLHTSGVRERGFVYLCVPTCRLV